MGSKLSSSPLSDAEDNEDWQSVDDIDTDDIPAAGAELRCQPLARPNFWYRLNTPASIEPCSGHVSAIQSISSSRQIMWVYGGFVYPDTVITDLYSIDLTTLRMKRHTTDGPAPTTGCSQTALIIANKLMVFGGTGYPFGEEVSNDIHVCDLGAMSWAILPCTGSKPPPRFGQVRMVYPQMYVFSLMACSPWCWLRMGRYTCSPALRHVAYVLSTISCSWPSC